MEVLTLQFGHFANHIGAHFWNFEDESAALQEAADEEEGTDEPDVDYSRLHCQSERGGAVAWHPRLVAVDLRGALGAFRAADDVEPEAATLGGLWDFGATRFCAEPVAAHRFQEDLEEEEQLWGQAAAARRRAGDAAAEMDVDDDGAGAAGGAGGRGEGGPSALKSSAEYDFTSTARTWTDFLKVRLPSASVHELRCAHRGATPFATFFDGLEIHGRGDEEMLLDLTRRQFELCDQLDAVHAVVDMCDGFGGVGDVVLRWVREEQPKCGKLVLGVQPEWPPVVEQPEALADGAGPTVRPQDVEAVGWLSAAFSFARLLDHAADAWVPAAVPLWSVEPPLALNGFRRDSVFQASALVATALQTATLPYRLCGALRPSGFLGALAPAHRPACGLLQAFPMPQPPLLLEPAQMGAGGTGGAGTSGQETLADLAGHFFDLSATRPCAFNPHTSLVLRGCAQPRRLLQLCAAMPPLARRLSFAHGGSLPLPVPFPQVFGPQVSRRGLLAAGGGGQALRADRADVEAAPVATRLHAAAGAAGRCGPLRHMAEAARSSLRAPWAAPLRERFGVEADELREVLETVREHLESCAAGGSSGGSEGCGGSDASGD